MRKTTHLILLSLLSSGLSAPIDVKEDAIEKRRDSTKETIELEEALKRLSGENKKFYPPPEGGFQPQVDGLDPHTNTDDGADEKNLLDLVKAHDTNEAELQDLDSDSAEIPLEEDDPVDEGSEDEGEKDIEEDGDDIFEPESNTDYVPPPQYVDYGSLYQDYYPDRYGEMENRVPPSYAMYDNINYQPMGEEYSNELQDRYGDIKQVAKGPVPSNDNNEYLLQNMFQVIQEHPEFLALLEKGQQQAREESDESWDEDEEGLNSLGNFSPPQDVNGNDFKTGNEISRPEEEMEEEDGLGEPQLDSVNQPLAMQQSGYNMDKLERNLENKAMIKQLETLQDIYGDKGAHSVAKKMSLMNSNYIQEIEELPEAEENGIFGSGEVKNINVIPTEIEKNTQKEEVDNEEIKGLQDFRQMSIM